jgi:ABC-type dipeptide/oligopeptide/nickel transport system ATPase component
MGNILFKYQEPVFNSLMETAETFFTQDWRNLPIKPRFSRFLVGPSGSGKTHIVQAVAEHLDVPFYNVEATNWMPLGATDRSSRNSWADLVAFLADNSKGIIFVDELDKLGDHDTPGSSWLRFLRVEIFTLLDRRIPRHMSLPEGFEEEDKAITFKRITQRLQNAMLIIGAGAFQSIWEARSKQKIGLIPSREPENAAFSHKDMQSVIPTELANRFASPVLVLPPLKESDYRQLLRRAASVIPRDLATRLTRNGKSDLRNAVDNHLGARWVEGLLLKSLLQKNAAERKLPELLNSAA